MLVLRHTLIEGLCEHVHLFQPFHGRLNTYVDCSRCQHRILPRVNTFLPSLSFVYSWLPDEPNTCTLNSFPGHSVCRMRSNFLTNAFRRSVLSWLGNNRSYSSRMSPLNFSSSCGSNVFFGSSFAFSSTSDDVYGILLFPNAALVSYLHRVCLVGALNVGMEPFASDDTERGEWLPRPPLGDGDLERDSYWRANWSGVDGTEFECCETTEGRWLRKKVDPFCSSRLPPIIGAPFDVIDGALR